MKSEKGFFLMAVVPLILVLTASIGIYMYNSANSSIKRATNMTNSYNFNYYDEEDDDDDYDFYNYSNNTITTNSTDFDWDV